MIGRFRAGPTRGSHGLPRPVPCRRGSIVARRTPRDLRSEYRERCEDELTSPSTHDMLPAFSPDGRTLAFTRQLMSPVFGAFVHVVPVAGGEPKVVVQPASGGGVDWPGLPAGRRFSSPRCLSHRTEVSRGHRRMEESVATCGGSLSTAGKPALWPGARGRSTWTCRGTDVASSIRRGRSTWISGALICGGGKRRGKHRPDSPRPPRTTPIHSFPPWGASGVHLGSERPDRDLGRRRARQALAPTDLSRRAGDRLVARGGPRTEK